MEALFEPNEELMSTFRQEGVRFAYVFGSHATGETRKDSDIDLAVMLSEKLTPERRFEKRLRLIEATSKIFKRNVDLVVLNDTRSLFFKYVIIKEGRPIYSIAEGDRAEFECRTMGLYFDFAPFLEEYNRAYVERNLK